MKTEFKYISQEMRQTWDNLVGKNPASGFMQSFYWADFKKKCGWKTYKIGLFEAPVGRDPVLTGGAIVMKCPSSAQTNFLYIPEGPVLDYTGPDIQKHFDALMMEINKIADKGPKQITTHLRIDPLLPLTPGSAANSLLEKFKKSPHEFQPLHTLMINLKPDEGEILEQMEQKGRYNIKIAGQHGVEVKNYPLQDGFEIFYDLYKKTAARNRFEGQSEDYFKKLISTGSASQYLKIFVAEHNKVPLAAAIVVFFGDRATYFFGASSDTGKELMAPYKLHWEIIKHAKEHGFDWYDFWGIAPEGSNQKHPWFGLSQFKHKFGGQQFAFVGAHDFIYQKEFYQKYIE